MNQRLKKEYENYMEWFNSTVRVQFPKSKPQTPEQFVWDKYRENVYWYLREEWTNRDISEVFYGDVDWEKEEESPEEDRGSDLQNACEEMVWDCFQKREAVSNAAGLVYEFLKTEGAVE